MYNLENGVEWTDELKDAFKHKITRAKILWSGDEINEYNHLKDLTLGEQQYISDYGFVGAATAKKLEVNFNGFSVNINLVDENNSGGCSKVKVCMSNSFAFGGSNACLIIGG